ETLRAEAVLGEPVRDQRRGGEVHGGREKLEDHLPAVPDTGGIGAQLYPGFHRPRAGGHQHAGSLDLHDAHPAGVDRMQRFEIAEGGERAVEACARIQNGGALGDGHRLAVDDQLDIAARPGQGNEWSRVRGGHWNTLRRFTADSTALYAVCPRPQMDASFMPAPISS